MKGLYLKATVVAMSLGVAASANAASAVSSTAGTNTVSAALDFQITIPRVLFLRVGTGSLFANSASIDKISFAPSIAGLGAGCGTPSDCAGTSGDLSGGAVTAQLVSNLGATQIIANTAGGTLLDGAGNSIPYSKITAATAALTAVPGQTLAGATLWNFPGWDTTVTYPAAANTVVNLAAKWTFSYANDTIPPAGVYGNTVANKGRVTFTATSP